MEQEKFYTIEEVAKNLRVHRATVTRWIKEGENRKNGCLKARKMGRRWLISETDYNTFVGKQGV